MAPANSLIQQARWRYVILLAGCAVLAPLSIDMYLPAIPALSSDLHADPKLASATMSIFLGTVAVGQIVFGPLSDRIGRRQPVLGGLAVYAIGSILAAVTESIMVLLAARILQALGACAAMVVGRSLVRDLFDHQESARFFSMMALVGAAGPVFAPSIGAGILLLTNWRAIFGVMGVMGSLLAIVSYFYLAESRSEATARQARNEHPLRSYWELFKQRRLLGYLLAAAFNGGAFFTYLASSPLVLMQAFHVSPADFGLLFSINGIGLIGGAQLNRILLKTHTPEHMLANSARNAILLAILFVVVPGMMIGGLIGLLVPMFLVVSSVSFIQANAMAGAMSVDPLRAGSTSALFGAAMFGMGMLASLVAGLLYDGTARSMVFVIASCLVGATLAIKLLALRPKE